MHDANTLLCCLLKALFHVTCLFTIHTNDLFWVKSGIITQQRKIDQCQMGTSLIKTQLLAVTENKTFHHKPHMISIIRLRVNTYITPRI